MSTYTLYAKVIVTGERLVMAHRSVDKKVYEEVLAEHDAANKEFDEAVKAELNKSGF